LPDIGSAATDLDLISYLKSIPEARMRRSVHVPAWYLLLVAVLGILSGCQSLRDLERYSFGEGVARAIRDHSILTEALGLKLGRAPSDSSFRWVFTRWTWRRYALRSATGRSPRSPVAQRFSISW